MKTLLDYAIEEGLTARQTQAVLSAFEAREGLSPANPLSQLDRTQFRAIAREVLGLN